MPQGNNNNPRAQKIDIENRLQIIAPLYRRGWTEREITAEVRKRLDRPKYNQAHCDIQRLLKEWREERLIDTDEKITSEVARLKLVIREAWEAWEKSKEDYHEKKSNQQGLPVVDEETRKILSIQTYYESMWIERGLNIKYQKFALPREGELVEPDIEIPLDDYRSYRRDKRSSKDTAK